MDLNLEIPDQRIASLLCTGFEGGMTGQWCRIMKHQRPIEEKPVLDGEREGGQIWRSYDYPLLTGGATICRLYEEETDKKYNPLVLDRGAVEKGLQIMRTKYPRHFGHFLAEQEDAITGDVFIQCCLLGELVYG